MFPFWDTVIKPIFDASDAKRVVEIGALRAENTVQVLAAMPDDAVMHVIDPVPQFDPDEHRRRFGERYRFHEALSHDVLPDLEPMDIALIDGDHNWYTVYHECRMLAEVSEKAARPLPIMLLHDVLWPYGRRDLYYSPDTVPEEFRQPYRRGGMRPGQSALAPRGGLNHAMCNATSEGGPRNGVMTGLDDFIAEFPRPLRHIIVPIYFGLSIVVEEAVIEANPALAATLDHIESSDGRGDLLELGESIRLNAMVWQHSVEEYRGRLYDHATTRYLDTVKAALVNEHYLEHELRLNHMLDVIHGGGQLDHAKLTDPARQMRAKAMRLAAARHNGAALEPADNPSGFHPWAPSGRHRLDRLHDALEGLRDGNDLHGDLVDCNVGRGGTSVFLRAFLDCYQLNHQSVWVIDTFGVDSTASDDEYPPNLNIVREGFDRFGLLDDKVIFAQGALPDAVAGADLGKITLLRIGGDSPEHARRALETLYPRVRTDGVVFVDTRSPEVVAVVEGYLTAAGAQPTLERIDESGLVFTKTDDAALAEPEVASPAARPALAGAGPGTVDLSVIVTFYNMAREADRTLHALSRHYQLDLDDTTYEVLVVDNGSAPEQALSADYVRSFGPEFRLVTVDPTPSPTTALNAALGEAEGRNIAFMIDGAHILTPRALSYGLLGLATYDPAIVLIQQWYVGPGQQHEAMLEGYDQAYEDRLFDQIDWPADGYRLFDIGSFIGDRDWFDGQHESNCLFAPRALLRQVGAFDDSFSMAGGGFANLDLYERLGSSPDVRVVSVLGEGSFHQIHGGTTTNQADVDRRGSELTGYREHYSDLRGRVFTGPGKPIHMIGSLHGSSKRTKARRMTSAALFGQAQEIGPDGRPAKPIPLTDEQKVAFIDAYWRSEDWKDSTWLGARTTTNPVDLFGYQEIVERVRPAWIIDVGSGHGGRAQFLASVCAGLEHGRVVSIGPDNAERPDTDRLVWITGDPYGADTAEQVRALVGDEAALVIVSRAHVNQLREVFGAYEDLVPVGSYVVFEETIVNGNPVWPAHGGGPAEFVRELIRSTSDFYVDPTPEQYAATFNFGGYLKRHRS